MRRQRVIDSGFTLVELLVVIGIIGVLIAILLPALSRARSTAKSTQCLSNLRGIGQAALLYANDFDDAVLPCSVSGTGGDDFWPFLLQARKYLPKSSDQNPTSAGVDSKSVLMCPSISEAPPSSTGTETGDARRATSVVVALAGSVDGQTGPLVTQWSYGINGSVNGGSVGYTAWVPCRAISYNPNGLVQTLKPPAALRRGNLPNATQLAFLFDGAEANWWTNGGARVDGRIDGTRHGKSDPTKKGTTGSTNVLFFDGHVESFSRAELPNGQAGADGMGLPTPTVAQRLSTLFPKVQWRMDQYR